MNYPYRVERMSIMNNPCQELYEKLSTLQWLLQRYRTKNFQRRGPFMDPTRGQGRVLTLLKNQSDMTTKDLSYILGIRQQSLNDLIKKLEKSGLVERVPSEKDKRVLIVRLTEKGKNYQTEEQDYSGMFAGFSEEELEQFSEYLSRMITTLSNDYGSPFDEDAYRWAEDFRGRMSEEEFERMMSMRRGMNGGFGFGRERFGEFGRGDFREERRGFGMGGRDFGPDSRGEAPKDMPGAERFDPDYDGPMPEDRMGFPFGRKKKRDDDKEPDGRE